MLSEIYYLNHIIKNTSYYSYLKMFLIFKNNININTFKNLKRLKILIMFLGSSTHNHISYFYILYGYENYRLKRLLIFFFLVLLKELKATKNSNHAFKMFYSWSYIISYGYENYRLKKTFNPFFFLFLLVLLKELKTLKILTIFHSWSYTMRIIEWKGS